jgi:hypothetical protein
MNTINEENPLITNSNIDILDRPRSLQWQIFQGTLYLIGSLCFTAGSCMYFTSVSRPYPIALTIGGWLFTIGSFIFLFADLQDWWDYRTGYCFSYKYHSTIDISLQSMDTSITSDNGENHKEIELNVYGSIGGIAFYLAGSILFIPIFGNYLAIGEWFFIFGSTFSYLSIIWKMYRSSCNNSDQKFHLITLLNDIPTLAMDIFSIIGNICFFIGTILFLSYINKNDFTENRAAFFFVFGSGCFILSSIVLQYTICCSRHR